MGGLVGRRIGHVVEADSDEARHDCGIADGGTCGSLAPRQSLGLGPVINSQQHENVRQGLESP